MLAADETHAYFTIETRTRPPELHATVAITAPRSSAITRTGLARSGTTATRVQTPPSIGFRIKARC